MSAELHSHLRELKRRGHVQICKPIVYLELQYHWCETYADLRHRLACLDHVIIHRQKYKIKDKI